MKYTQSVKSDKGKSGLISVAVDANGRAIASTVASFERNFVDQLTLHCLV